MTRVKFAVPLLALTVLTCFAVGRPHLDIRELVTSSDLIIVADASEKTHVGTAAPLDVRGRVLPARQYSTQLHIRTVIKGSCSRDIAAMYVLPLEFAGYLPLQTGTRMVFLKRSGNSYEPASPYYPDMPATGTALYTDGSKTADEVFARVLNELAGVIASPAVPEQAKFEVLTYDYAIPQDAQFIVALKEGIRNASDQRLRETLQSHLLRRGDLSELSQVTDVLLKNVATSEGKAALLYAIANRLKDSRAVPAVLSLLSSADAGTRVAAAEALWHIADGRATSDLVRSLDDPKYEVRYYAVRALADITGQNLWGPSIPEFKERELVYLQHWKKWADENGFISRGNR